MDAIGTNGADRKRKKIFWLIAGVAVLAATFFVLRPDVRSVKGTVVRVDPATRRATLEIVDPRGGNAFEITGSIPPECEILIDEQKASLEDIRIGDFARVKGRLYWDKSVIAQRVRVERTKPASGRS